MRSRGYGGIKLQNLIFLVMCFVTMSYHVASCSGKKKHNLEYLAQSAGAFKEMIKLEDIIGKQTHNMNVQYKPCGQICTETVRINSQTHTLTRTHTHLHKEAFF